MPRAIWSGSISFGLVNVPVKLYPAVKKHDIHFNQFEEGTGSRIRYERVSEKTGKEVPWEKIVKGYEVSKGKYVMVTPEELEAVEPEQNKTIDIEDFVDLADIDPIFYEATYYVAPAGTGGAGKAYALLLQAMEHKGKVGIGRFVMRTKQYLAAVRPFEGVLALSTLLFEDEVVERKDISELERKPSKASDREVRMATQIIDALATDWKPARYEDTYRDKVMAMIKRKQKGEEITVEEAPDQPAKVTDLMAALEASLKATKSKPATKAASRSKKPAKKSA